MITELKFEWDSKKDAHNRHKHGVSFEEAKQAFYDKQRVFRPDLTHSVVEDRVFCFGKVSGEVMTVRFTMRGEIVRIIGAAYWREGREYYEEENNL
jgi:uncharacterized DUF497 family protein